MGRKGKKERFYSTDSIYGQIMANTGGKRSFVAF